MARPTLNPIRTLITGYRSIRDGTVRSPELGTDAVGATHMSDGSVRGPQVSANTVGITQAADVIKRNVTVVTLGVTPATAFNATVFRAPPSGAQITGLNINFGSTQNHAATEADVWVWDVENARTGTDLSVNAQSLSNQTLAATAWRTTSLNNNAGTLLSGEGLRIKLSISGSPDALQSPAVAIEWKPVTNA